MWSGIIYLWVIAVYAHPFALHGLAQLRQFYARLISTSCQGKGIAHQVAEDWAATFHLKGNHIHAPLGVVVMVVTTFHRGFLLTGENLFRCNLLVCHLLYSSSNQCCMREANSLLCYSYHNRFWQRTYQSNVPLKAEWTFCVDKDRIVFVGSYSTFTSSTSLYLLNAIYIHNL